VAPAASLLLMLLMLSLAYTEQAGNRTPEPLTQFFSVFSKFFENLFFLVYNLFLYVITLLTVIYWLFHVNVNVQ